MHHVRTGMKRRQFLSLLAAAPVALLAASCGSSDNGSSGETTTVPTSTLPPVTTAAGIAHPTGADEIILRLAWDGGFVAPGTLFMRLPRVLIAGDGSVYVQGAQIEMYPGPLLPPILVGKITEAEIQDVLAKAFAANLFRQITYGQPDVGIADAPNTILILNVNGTTYTHDAYALGMGGTDAGETNPDRKAFADFVAQLEPLTLGVKDSQPYAAPRFAIRATPADQAPPPDDIKPNEAQWPVAAGVKLAAASECAVVEATAVGTLFANSTQITQFVDEGVKYVLVVRPMLPGDAGC